jgi:hypothetical protein
MNERVEVECTFDEDGRVHLRRLKLAGEWRTVEQGRQWQDEDGRHVLFMLPGQPVQELLQDLASQCWELRPRRLLPPHIV